MTPLYTPRPRSLLSVASRMYRRASSADGPPVPIPLVRTKLFRKCLPGRSRGRRFEGRLPPPMAALLLILLPMLLLPLLLPIIVLVEAVLELPEILVAFDGMDEGSLRVVP